jgi:hypothetical protein
MKFSKMKKLKKPSSKFQTFTKFVFDNLGALIVVAAVISAGVAYAWDPGPAQGTPVEGNVELTDETGVTEQWVEDYVDATVNATPTPPNSGKIVFVTSRSFNGGLGGVDAYHAECMKEAEAFDLPGTYKAWIASTADDDPESTHTHSTTPYYIWQSQAIGGWVKIADDWDDLTDGELKSPISYTLYGESASGQVCTNVGITGVLNNPDKDCSNWTNITNTSLYAKTGVPTSVTSTWTDPGGAIEYRYKNNGCAPLDGYRLSCMLYCFQQ